MFGFKKKEKSPKKEFIVVGVTKAKCRGCEQCFLREERTLRLGKNTINHACENSDKTLYKMGIADVLDVHIFLKPKEYTHEEYYRKGRGPGED